MDEGLAEWIVTAPGGEQMLLQMAYFDRGREPVLMDIGPVLDLEDVVGGKVCALASRNEPRDYADVAAALQHYSTAQLISFATRLDPGLTGQDFADAGLRLDQMDNRAFANIGLGQHEITALREHLAAWPRDAHAADRQLHPDGLAENEPGHEQKPSADPPDPGTQLPDPAGSQHPGHKSAGQARWDDPEAAP